MQPSKLSILIADDHEIVRRGLRGLLSSRPNSTVVGEAITGRDAITMAALHQPDIVVMDISMPQLNGLEATRQIRKLLPRTEILILSVHYSDQLIREILDAGARGYASKSDASRDLLDAIDAIANHRSFFASRAAQLVCDEFFNREPACTQVPLMRHRLTSREREIVQLLAEGKRSRDVALMLGISVNTAEAHRANIMRKLEIHTVGDLVRYAVRNQMIEA